MADSDDNRAAAEAFTDGTAEGIAEGSANGTAGEGTVPIVHAEAVSTDDGGIKKILVLVVDDVTENNPREIHHLKSKGYNVITTTSTSSTMTLLHSGIEPDIIISDMGRREDSVGMYGYNPTAGLLLIEEVRKTGRMTPIIIFTSSDNWERYREETMRLGGSDIVYQSSDLYEAVADALPMAPAYVEES